MRDLRIAVDYDDTFSADTEMFRELIETMLRRGADVRIVTARGEEGKIYETVRGPIKVRKGNNADLLSDIEGLGIDVMYCGWQQKRTYCRNHGWQPDIWMDDMPEAIVE